jgi:hypothetical protein
MPKFTANQIRPENPEEAELRKALQGMALASPETIETAARQIITLVSALLTALLGLLALSSDPLPAYMRLGSVRMFATAAVLFLLGSLALGLLAVLPGRWYYQPAKPASEARMLNDLLRWKEAFLTASVAAFWLGLLALGVVTLLALWSA